MRTRLQIAEDLAERKGRRTLRAFVRLTPFPLSTLSKLFRPQVHVSQAALELADKWLDKKPKEKRWKGPPKPKPQPKDPAVLLQQYRDLEMFVREVIANDGVRYLTDRRKLGALLNAITSPLAIEK